MFRKTVLGIASLLLFIGMLTSAYSIQPVEEDRVQARVVEHRISALELEGLKQKVGVREEGRNYNEVINGHGTGLRPPTEEEWVEIEKRAFMVESVLFDEPIQRSSSVDHTVTPWLPPIGNQAVEGSCTAWVVGYYMKTFQEAKEHGWDLSGAEWGPKGPTSDYQDRIFSPDFIYHLINEGVDQGSTFEDAINLVCGVGASSWEEMPYDAVNSTAWPSEEAWREAPLYRGNNTGYEYLDLDTNNDLTSLKNWIASDHLAAISVDADQYPRLTREDFWTLDDYVNPETNHANTIVGYDDNIEYFEDGQSRRGAFKIANSWGVGDWENIPDGCYWISYETMKQRVEYAAFYRDRIDYRPELVSSFRIDHSNRRECDILIGMGNPSNPAATKSFSDLIDGGDHPFCPNNIVFDITEFRDAASVINQSFFMKVCDGGIPPAHSGVYKWDSDGGSYSWFRLGQTFDISETGATLKFWSYYEIEEDWDYGYVEVHDLDADEWYTLPGTMTVSTLPEPQDNPNCPGEFEPEAYYEAGRWNAFTGFSSVIYQEEMDLTPFADHTIELYFTYWTDPYVLEKGWYIDDIEIPEVGFFDDVESGPGDWTYKGWYIADLEPPNTGTINSFSIELYYRSYGSGPYERSTSNDLPVNTEDQECVFVELILKRVPRPDLLISSISWSPIKPEEGETVTFTVSIKNNGTEEAGLFTTPYYIDDVKLGEWSITSLSTGQEVNKTFTWIFVEGSHTVEAFVDSNNDVEEIDETNNEKEEIVGDQPPIASFCYNNSYNYLDNSIIFMSESTRFNASESYDSDGTIVSYTWNFGDGNITIVTSSNVHHNYTNVGTYTVTLNITDNQNLWDTETANVKVTLLGDLNDDDEVNILDIAIVARAYGSKLEDPTWNPIADLNNDEVINILDIALVAAAYGKKA